MANLTCTDDIQILVDKIVPMGEKMSYYDAVSYCEEELEGQLWGDIDIPPNNLLVGTTPG